MKVVDVNVPHTERGKESVGVCVWVTQALVHSPRKPPFCNKQSGGGVKICEKKRTSWRKSQTACLTKIGHASCHTSCENIRTWQKSMHGVMCTYVKAIMAKP